MNLMAVLLYGLLTDCAIRNESAPPPLCNELDLDGEGRNIIDYLSGSAGL